MIRYSRKPPLPEARANLQAQPSDASLSLQGEGQAGGLSERGGVNRFANPKIKQNAKTLRRDMTDAEKSLWHHLRAKRFSAFKFRRQHPIGSYIVDFVCLKQALIIELDGGQHNKQTGYETAREAFLKAQGFTVLRFWNNEMLENQEAVLEIIMNHLSTPSLALPLKGEGMR